MALPVQVKPIPDTALAQLELLSDADTKEVNMRVGEVREFRARLENRSGINIPLSSLVVGYGSSTDKLSFQNDPFDKFKNSSEHKSAIPPGQHELVAKVEAKKAGACVPQIMVKAGDRRMMAQGVWNIETPVLTKEFLLKGTVRILGAPKEVHNGFGASEVFDAEGCTKIRITLVPSGTSGILSLDRLGVAARIIRGKEKIPAQKITVTFPTGIFRSVPEGKGDIIWDKMGDTYSGRENLVLEIEDARIQPGDSVFFLLFGTDIAWSAMEQIITDTVKGIPDK
jgi:hypothetical protein